MGKLKVLIDDCNKPLLSLFTWGLNGGGYVRAAVPRMLQPYLGKSVFMHRLITGARHGEQVDHINEEKLDNRMSNLRKCSQSENLMNRGKCKNATSQYKGVSKFKGSWRCVIVKNKKQYYMGTFRTEHHAALAYDMWAEDFHGQFSRLNFKKAI